MRLPGMPEIADFADVVVLSWTPHYHFVNTCARCDLTTCLFGYIWLFSFLALVLLLIHSLA
jgi:hypothetical protein